MVDVPPRKTHGQIQMGQAAAERLRDCCACGRATRWLLACSCLVRCHCAVPTFESEGRRVGSSKGTWCWALE